jgi:hypothetical protein
MHSPVKFLLCLALLPLHSANFAYNVSGDDPGPWPRILSSIGLTTGPGVPANLFVVRAVAPGSIPQWTAKIDQGAIVILEGQSDLAESLGFHPTEKRVVVRSIIDQRAPKLPIVWKRVPSFASSTSPKMPACSRPNAGKARP